MKRMKIGVIYLGQMDSSVCCLLMSARHQYVVFDINDEPLASLSKQGAKAVGSLAKVVSALQEKPRAIWVMLPAGEATEETVGRLSNLLEPHDIIVDDGSSYYKDDIRHAKRLGEKGIRYVD
jgi:6-phosphogluconate dehydrogenase